jgi:hypothetical protein
MSEFRVEKRRAEAELTLATAQVKGAFSRRTPSRCRAGRDLLNGDWGSSVDLADWTRLTVSQSCA